MNVSVPGLEFAGIADTHDKPLCNRNRGAKAFVNYGEPKGWCERLEALGGPIQRKEVGYGLAFKTGPGETFSRFSDATLRGSHPAL